MKTLAALILSASLVLTSCVESRELSQTEAVSMCKAGNALLMNPFGEEYATYLEYCVDKTPVTAGYAGYQSGYLQQWNQQQWQGIASQQGFRPLVVVPY